MSEPPGMMGGMYNPWQRLGSLPEWTLRWQRSELTDGLTCFATRTLTLDPRQLQVERRCTLAHELVHIARGPVPDDDWLAAREEAAVEQQTARELISLDTLLDALKWSRDPHEVADLCWVTVEVLTTRIQHLHPAERHFLETHLEDI